MKDQTAITLVGMVLVVVFGLYAVSQGYDNYLIGFILWLLGIAMGLPIPRPEFLRRA